MPGGFAWMQDVYVDNFRHKRALITGGLGFVGSNLAIKLVRECGADVTLFSRGTDKIRNVKEILPSVRLVQGDVANYDDVSKQVQEMDYVFHLAAQTSNITSMESPFLDVKTNIGGTLSILEACRKHNPDVSIVSVGTVTQIGKPLTIPVDESHPSVPQTIYDANKMLCEHYFRIYHQVFGLKTAFLRLPTVYGERQEVMSPRTGIVNSFIAKALMGKKIKIFGDGEFLRDYLYVGDLVDALILSASKPSTAGQFFQVVTGRGVQFVEMVRTVISTVERLTGRKGHYEHVPWPTEWKMVDMGSFVGNNSKLKELLGWTPRTSLEEGVERTTRFYIERLNDYFRENNERTGTNS